MLDHLRAAVESADLALDGDVLAQALALRDRLDARLAEAVAGFDAAGLWDAEGATSMTGWLVDRGAMLRRTAATLVRRARLVSRLPVVAGAWRDGRLSGGQVEAICAHLDTETVGLFAAHEAEVVPALVDLPAVDVAAAMRAWREYALADAPPAEPAPQSLHLSRLPDGTHDLTGRLDDETGELLETSLRLAATPDVEGEPPRSVATRRADALRDLCRHFLDHQQTRRAGRHRPHVNIVLDLERYLAGAGAETIGGGRLSRQAVDRYLCDAALHRVLTQGRSAILDYGSATRTIPAPLWNALVIRDRRCRFPGCDRPTHWCEGHHIRPWEHGGPTRLDNLVLLCTRHHHVLHRPGWHAKLLPDATLEVTDARGRVRTTSPPAAVPQTLLPP